MSTYLDASVVVAFLTPEAHSDRVERWFGDNAASDLVVSPWVTTEISSALSIKLRAGAITLDHRAAVLARWQQMLDANVTTVSVTDAHFDAAARFADRHDLGLRAGDALHLAIAAQSGCTLVTLDHAMATAAPALGIPVQPL